MSRTANRSVVPSPFWRDAALPFIEARTVDDGRTICYAKHTHDTFSVGAIVGGTSTYVNGATNAHVGRGVLVIIDPEQVHACNPYGPDAWAYRMVYVDVPWLARLQHSLGRDHGFSQKLTERATCSPWLLPHARRARRRSARQGERGGRVLHGAARRARSRPARPARRGRQRPARARDYIAAHCREGVARCDLRGGRSVAVIPDPRVQRPLRDDAACVPDRSPRAVRPHGAAPRPADRRRRAGRGLRRPAHFQRAFRRIAAATPGQYRSAS